LNAETRDQQSKDNERAELEWGFPAGVLDIVRILENSAWEAGGVEGRQELLICEARFRFCRGLVEGEVIGYDQHYPRVVELRLEATIPTGVSSIGEDSKGQGRDEDGLQWRSRSGRIQTSEELLGEKTN